MADAQAPLTFDQLTRPVGSAPAAPPAAAPAAAPAAPRPKATAPLRFEDLLRDPTEKPDPMAAFEGSNLTRPTAGSTGPAEIASAAGRMTLGGLMEGGGMAAGAASGFALGTPLGPPGQLAGTLIGGGLGLFAGHTAREATVGQVAELPPELRRWGVLGESFGGQVPFIFAPIGLGALGYSIKNPGRVGQFVNGILRDAVERPARFIAAELAATTQSAIFASEAEHVFPGQPLPRITAEVVGGLTNPARLYGHIIQGSWHTVRRVAQSLSQGGRESAATRHILEVAGLVGEDPAKIVALLKATDIPGVASTAAQKTGTRTWSVIEAGLARESAKFGSESERMAEESMEALDTMIHALRGTGEPEALREAVRLRGVQFRTLLDARVQVARDAAVDSASKIAPDVEDAAADAGRRAASIIDGVMTEARGVEAGLWGQIDRSLVIDSPTSLTATIEGMIDERGVAPELVDQLRQLVPELSHKLVRASPPAAASKQPDMMKALLDGVFTEAVAAKADHIPLTSGALLDIRSKALTKARELSAAGRFDDARIMGEVAESALDDLNRLPSVGPLDEAREFSRALNDTFTRTFAGKVRQTARTGARRIPPELMMRRAFAAGGEVAELHLRELEDATRFLDDLGKTSPAAAEQIDTMMGAQDSLIRLAASSAVDSKGKINPEKLRTFMSKQSTLLKRFPEVRADIEAALTDDLVLSQFESLATGAGSRFDSAFKSVLGVENPVDAIGRIIGGPRPLGELKNVARAAQRSGPRAVEGMKGAVWDHVFRLAGGDPASVRSALFNPIRPGRPALADLMEQSGVWGASDTLNARKLLDRMDKIVAGTASVRDVSQGLDNPDMLTDLVARWMGAEAGSAVAGQSPSLVMAGAGSRAMRKLLGNFPQTQVRTVLEQAAKDPKFAAMLMERPTSTADELRLTRHVHAYLVRALGVEPIMTATGARSPTPEQQRMGRTIP